MSSFYSANDLVDGDAYNVAFTNTGGLQYCGGSCSNTGNEVLSRRSSVADVVGTQHIPRKFVTDSGHELISKSSDHSPILSSTDLDPSMQKCTSLFLLQAVSTPSSALRRGWLTKSDSSPSPRLLPNAALFICTVAVSIGYGYASIVCAKESLNRKKAK